MDLYEQHANILSQMEAMLASEDAYDAEAYTKLETELAQCEAKIEKFEALKSKTKREPKVDAPKTAPVISAPSVNPETVTTREGFEDDPNRGFQTEAEYLIAVRTAGVGGPIDARLVLGDDEQRAGDNSLGGFLIPEGFLTGVVTMPQEGDPLAGRTTMIPMTNSVIHIPYRVDKDRRESVSGGLNVKWTAEATEIDSSKMKVARMKLEAHELAGLSYVTDRLLRESPVSIAALISQGFNEEFGSKLLDAKLFGSGVGQYEGLVECDAAIEVPPEGGQATNSVTYQNLKDMRVQCYGYGNAIWMFNHDCMADLMEIKDGDNRYIWQESARDDIPGVIMGRPVFFSDSCKSIGNKGDALLIDGSQYYEGVYYGIEQAESIHVRFESAERAYRFMTMRAGGSSWERTLYPKNGTLERSPFISLGDRL